MYLLPIIFISVSVVTISVLIAWLRAAIRGYRGRAIAFPTHAPKQFPLVSLLVPAWNERTILGECVASWKALKYPNWECILVAGGLDGTLQYARELTADDPRFKVIHQGEGGKNAALNDGLRQAKGDIFVLLDADCVVEPEWLCPLVGSIEAGADACLANYFPTPVTPISQQFEMDKISSYFIRGATTLHGGAIVISRAMVDKLGGSFPESVLVGVDWDLNMRLERLGVRKEFVEAARHITPHPATWSQFIKNELRWRRAHLSSVLRFQENSLKAYIELLFGLAPYVTGWLFLALPIAALLLASFAPSLSMGLLFALTLYIAWIMGRRMSQVIEVAAYHGDWRWLSLFWVPPATLIVSLVCSAVALVSLRQLSAHFKGPRPVANREGAA